MKTEIKVSIIVPCYNERTTIEKIIDKIYSKNIFKFEVIIIDDFSNDGSREIIEKLELKYPNLRKVFHENNLGKGSAIRSGIKISEGNIILVQDLDLEYDPDDYEQLIEPFLKYDADVVYGSRFIGVMDQKDYIFFGYQVANKVLTLITNIFTNLNMTDMETVQII